MRGYYNKKGARITTDEDWSKLREDPRYSQIKIFENGRLKVTAEWVGVVENPKVVPREYWTLFELRVYNVLVGGDGQTHYALDPTVSEAIATEKEVVEKYHEFLESYTDSHWSEEESFYAKDDEVERFIEVGNIHTPPDPNIPTQSIEKEEVEDNVVAGSW
jgi:hypothetical protein